MCRGSATDVRPTQASNVQKSPPATANVVVTPVTPVTPVVPVYSQPVYSQPVYTYNQGPPVRQDHEAPPQSAAPTVTPPATPAPAPQATYAAPQPVFVAVPEARYYAQPAYSAGVYVLPRRRIGVSFFCDPPPHHCHSHHHGHYRHHW